MNIITTLVIGGCKSGKSRYALDLADNLAGNSKIFVATSVPADSEMEERVKAHKNERGKNWLTIEEPISIASVIKKYSKEADVILIDCLTLWISNLLHKNYDKKKILEYTQELINSMQDAECPVILVSNEVGAGIVPENKLARLFRDIAGITNQTIAAAVTNVVWTIAGIPVNIKNKNGME
jgi:adenosylcobinamide kinase / adenosylcobinamide-phosphate guanylyltransferase